MYMIYAFDSNDTEYGSYDPVYQPVVSLFIWPPDIPLLIASPTTVSAHVSSPSILIVMLDCISVVLHEQALLGN